MMNSINISSSSLAPPVSSPEFRRQAEGHARAIRAGLREGISRAKVAGRITPEAVVAYAALHLADDGGFPLQPAPHHWLWLQLACDERIRKLLFIAPPESAKTTWLISAYAGCHIGFFPERSVIIGSASGSIAEKRSVSLRAMVETQSWQMTFPDVLPIKAGEGLKWSTLEWSVAPGGVPRAGRLHPTIAAYGTGGSIIGSRADLVIGDDLLDFDNSRTAHQRQFVEMWMHNSLLSRRKAGIGRAILIGNAWHHEDLYAKARREGGWVVCHMPILSDSEQVYANLTYPDDWPFERLGEPVAQAEV